MVNVSQQLEDLKLLFIHKSLLHPFSDIVSNMLFAVPPFLVDFTLKPALVVGS